MDIQSGNYSLNNLNKINIILGKNGCGKSSLLKEVEANVRNQNSSYGVIKYITPERGGKLTYEPSIDHSIASSPTWILDTRRTNRLENFRQQSVAQFRNLELLFYRELEANANLRQDLNYTFDQYFLKINSLLDNIEIQRDKSLFKIFKKGQAQEISPDHISSGESELISLGIECLVFEKECVSAKPNILFLDEPDVHLHPDLQARLTRFLCDLVTEKNVIIILATHSTAILGALSEYNETCIEFMSQGQTTLDFKEISDEYRKILPVFGAHPLSNLFNRAPIFLIEGEDDERIWQQVVRTANRNLLIYPCCTDGKENMTKYEQDINKIVKSVYDQAKAYSLRDRDDGQDDIDDLGIVKRFKLGCRASENLLLSTEVLETLDTVWNELKIKIDNWLSSNKSHPHYQTMENFKKSDYDRKNFNLKEIRNDLMHIISKSIAWEIAIGKTLGKLISENKLTENSDENSIYNYLGKKLMTAISNKR